MLTVEQVIAIYANYEVEISAKDAAEDIEQALGDNPTRIKFVNRINGYAAQVALEQRCDAAEAREFQSHYD